MNNPTEPAPRPTPRTDALAFRVDRSSLLSGTEVVKADDMRQMERELARALFSLSWHRDRVELLAGEQSRMRDSERTLVCDILANGQLLPDPEGKRYGPIQDDMCPKGYSWHPRNRIRGISTWKAEIVYANLQGYRLAPPDHIIPHFTRRLFTRRLSENPGPKLYVMRENGIMSEFINADGRPVSDYGYPIYLEDKPDEINETQ